MCLCPAHDDHKHSLSVSAGNDGKILLHCHAGCSLESILAAIGVNPQDLFPDSGNSNKHEIEAIYDYKTAEGKLHHQTIRYINKDFNQRRPDGFGGWIYKQVFKDITPVLYRLPQVLEAVKTGQTVYIVEGEKDADSLAKLGLTATTNPMGAGKWRDHYAGTLEGANVVILPDNDESGQKHAQAIVRSLQGKAKSIKVLELPGLPLKGDVSDWLAAGGTKEEFLSLAESTPEFSKTLSSFVTPIYSSDAVTNKIIRLCDVAEPEPMTFIVEDFVPENYPTLVFGDGGQGKSYIMLYLATAVAIGKAFLGRATTKGNVLYVDFELDKNEQARRGYKVARGLGLDKPPDGLFYYSPLGQEGQAGSLNVIIESLAQSIKEHNITLTIIDSFGAAVAGDPESGKDVIALFQRIRRLGTLIILDHQSKRISGEKYTDKTAFGSVYKTNLSRNIWQVQRLPDNDAENELKLALHHKKSNFGPIRDTVALKAVFGDAFTLEEVEIDESFADALDIKMKVYLAFKELGRATAADVAEHTGENERTIKNKITVLKGEGRLIDTGEKEGKQHIYRPSVTSSLTLSDGDGDESKAHTCADTQAENMIVEDEVIRREEPTVKEFEALGFEVM